MTKLRQSDFANVSFPDCTVTQSHITKTRLECVLDGIYIEYQGFIEATVILTISDWDEAVVEQFDANENMSIAVPIEDSGEFLDICKCDLKLNEAILAGFEKQSGLWQSIKFKSPTITIEILDKDRRIGGNTASN